MELNRRKFAAVAGAAVLGIGFCGCRSAPLTGRRQLMLVPEGQEISLGATAFEETLSSEPLSDDQRMVDIVNRVGQRIAAVSGRDDFAWDFRLIASETQNAFCLPGGKVAFYEGILPVCRDEAGIAVVMSHEIAHALARHGGERMSQNMGVNGAKTILEKVSLAKAPDRTEKLLQAYGVATQYGVLLPYSRRQESEADHIGVMLMARAGYDPAVAPDFWMRFGQMKTDQPAEWLSTHPSDSRRSADLQQLMVEAEQLYSTTPQKFGTGEVLGV